MPSYDGSGAVMLRRRLSMLLRCSGWTSLVRFTHLASSEVYGGPSEQRCIMLSGERSVRVFVHLQPVVWLRRDASAVAPPRDASWEALGLL